MKTVANYYKLNTGGSQKKDTKHKLLHRAYTKKPAVFYLQQRLYEGPSITSYTGIPLISIYSSRLFLCFPFPRASYPGLQHFFAALLCPLQIFFRRDGWRQISTRRILVKLFHINGVTGFQHQRASKICFPDFFHESGPIHCAFIGQEMFVCLSVIVMYVEGEYPIPMAVQQAKTVGCRQMVMACIKTKPNIGIAVKVVQNTHKPVLVTNVFYRKVDSPPCAFAGDTLHTRNEHGPVTSGRRLPFKWVHHYGQYSACC